MSSSTLIIFIASILVAASVAGTMTSGVQRLSSALGDRSADVSEEIRTDVEIISDPASSNAVYNSSSDTLTLLVKNTGSQTLSSDAKLLDVIVDGKYATSVSVEIVDGPEWSVGNVARVNATGVSLTGGDHRAVVIVNSDREVLRFRT